MVPRFSSLAAFIRYKSCWAQTARYVPGAERDDLGARMRRHNPDQPSFSFLQIPFKPAPKVDISLTSDPYKPYKHGWVDMSGPVSGGDPH